MSPFVRGTNPKSGLSFQMITALKPSEYQYSSAHMDCNLKKNRCPGPNVIKLFTFCNLWVFGSGRHFQPCPMLVGIGAYPSEAPFRSLPRNVRLGWNKPSGLLRTLINYGRKKFYKFWPDLIPVESSRIPLAPKPGVEGSDYINASW